MLANIDQELGCVKSPFGGVYARGSRHQASNDNSGRLDVSDTLVRLLVSRVNEGADRSSDIEEAVGTPQVLFVDVPIRDGIVHKCRV